MNLFNRHMFSSAHKEGENLIVKANICDSFHEMTLEVKVSTRSFEIMASEIEILRVPYQQCFDARKLGENLIGLKIGSGVGKEINRRVGKNTGCVHVNELAFEAVRAVIQSTFPIPHDNLSLEEKRRLFENNFNMELKSTCQVYNKLFHKGE